MADLANPGDEVLVARGGQGGVRNLWVLNIITMLGISCFYLFFLVVGILLLHCPQSNIGKRKKNEKKKGVNYLTFSRMCSLVLQVFHCK